MNVIKVYGGLGNQFFQYALGRAQIANGIHVKFNFDWYKNSTNSYRPFVLDKFHTYLRSCKFLNQRNIYEGKIRNIDPTKVDCANFYGYWQDPTYFESILSILKEEFKLKPECWDAQSWVEREEILENESVSLHVRHGDFIGKVNILPIQYYIDALKYTKGNVYIFSDDYEWCKTNFPNGAFGRSFNYVGEDCWRDFELMRLCKYNIIANSTFSWWAAMLNDNPDKVVIAPKQWRLTQQAQDNMSNKFLRPNGWLIL